MKNEDQKYYFFRDLTHEDNLQDDVSFHAAGLVEKVFNTKEDSDKNKDLSVMFFDPFTGEFTNAWRAYFEVELFEVEEWRWEELRQKLIKYQS